MDKSREKVKMPAGMRNKLMAATAMLMISCVMMVSTTYAWFTLSTAPEVKNIATTVAGNGSLEIALMPASGSLAEIGTGTSSDGAASEAVLAANRTWGNIVQLSDASYGWSQISLNPAALNVSTTGEDGSQTTTFNAASPLAIAEYGYDGRIDSLDGETTIKSTVNADGTSVETLKGAGYGVRAIGVESTEIAGQLGDSYGYIVDLAFRLNSTNGDTSGKLLLQTEAVQRIYNGTEEGATETTNPDTMGGGSYMSFNNDTGVDLAKLMPAIRVTFVANYGVAGGTPEILGTAKLGTAANEGTSLKAPLYLYDDAGTTQLTGNAAVILDSLEKNTAKQVSAIVWLDGSTVTNSSVLASETATVFSTATLNLQFATDLQLNPADNNALIQGSAE